MTIKRGGLPPVEYTWTRDCVSLFTRKASFLHSMGSSCGDDVFQPVSTELVHCHNLLSRLRIVTSLPPPPFFNHTASEEIFPRDLCTRLTFPCAAPPSLVQSSIALRIIFSTFPSWPRFFIPIYVSIVTWIEIIYIIYINNFGRLIRVVLWIKLSYGIKNLM